MALLKFGALVTSGSGSLGGHTIQHSKGGMQLRNKPMSISIPSDAQLLIRSYNPILQAGWKSLTDAQRLVWNNHAKYPLSGHDLWMKLQFFQLEAGFPLFPDMLTVALGSELCYTWLNHPSYKFESFISSGKKIISAINTTSYAFCGIQPFFPIVIGRKYFIQMNFTKLSGAVSYVCIGRWDNVSVASNTVVPVNGSKSFILTATQNTNFGSFSFRCVSPVNFKLNNISVKQIL